MIIPTARATIYFALRTAFRSLCCHSMRSRKCSPSFNFYRHMRNNSCDKRFSSFHETSLANWNALSCASMYIKSTEKQVISIHRCLSGWANMRTRRKSSVKSPAPGSKSSAYILGSPPRAASSSWSLLSRKSRWCRWSKSIMICATLRSFSTSSIVLCGILRWTCWPFLSICFSLFRTD